MTRRWRDSGSEGLALAARALPLWSLLLIALLASASLWGPGIVNTRGGGDSPFLLQRTHQMAVNLRAGLFPARWMPDAAYGLGYPFFNHYSALPFYLAASFYLLGLDLLTALKLTQTIGFLIAAWAMFAWVDHIWRNRAASWLAAVAYTFAPFHLANVYVRGDSLSEFYAFAFYPLILWALERVVARDSENPRTKKNRSFYLIVLALAYAGLVLSHNISAFIFSPFVLLYLLALVGRAIWKPERVDSPAEAPSGFSRRGRWPEWGRMVKPLGPAAIGLLLGAALAAWAWLPALLELDYVQPENLTGDFFHYGNHFRTANLIQPSLLFDYSIASTTDGSSPFAMGGPQAVIAIVGLFVLLRFARGKKNEPSDGRRKEHHGFIIIGLLFSTAMITPISRPLWDHFPLLDQVQFPWRFLSVQAFFTAVAAAACVVRLKGRTTWTVVVAVAAVLITSVMLPLGPERLPIGPNDVTTARLQEYELFTGNIGTTVRYEWLPQDALPRPFTFDTVIAPEAPPQTIPLAGTLLEATQTLRHPVEQVWRLRTAAGGATLAFPLLYWPGWQAWVDSESTPVWAVEGAGYLALDVPAGEHTVRLKLGRTPLRTGAETLSLISFLGVLAVVLIRARLDLPRSPRRVAHDLLRPVPYALLVLVGLVFLALKSSPPPSHPEDMTMDFVAMPYLHHNPDGVAFADPKSDSSDVLVRLSSYSLSTDELGPGETFDVTLRWEDQQLVSEKPRVSLRLVSAAEHLAEQFRNTGATYTLAESDAALTPTTVHRLTVPENTPRGLYLLQLALWGAEGELSARTPSGEGRGRLYLRPVRVTEGAPVSADAPLLALVGPDIHLHAAELEQAPLPSGASSLTARLEWSSVRRLGINYGISIRLLDPSGTQRVNTDTQPGYGFAPTSLWRPDERVADRYILALPDDLVPGDGYRLVFVFYRHPSTAEVARVELGPFTLPLESPAVLEPSTRLFDLPPLSHSLDVDFVGSVDSVGGDLVRLAGYDLVQEDLSLALTLWWIAQRQPRTDYTVFVHLFDPANEEIIVQHDSMPRNGSYPTSGWLTGEVVSETIRFALDDVPPGDYRLGIGLYDATTRDRLSATSADGALLPGQRLVLPDAIGMPQE